MAKPVKKGGASRRRPSTGQTISVEIMTSIAGAGIEYRVGQIVDVPIKLGRAYIRTGAMRRVNADVDPVEGAGIDDQTDGVG